METPSSQYHPSSAAIHHLSRPFPPLPPPSVYGLKMAQVICRHGERSPIKFVLDGFSFSVGDRGLCSTGSFLSKLTPRGNHGSVDDAAIIHLVYKERIGSSQLSNCAAGQLTDVGKASLFKLGSNLREAYVNRVPLLKRDPDPAEIAVRSTEIPRAIESAQNLLHGLFPAWAAREAAQNVALDIHINEWRHEYFYPNLTDCPWLQKEFQSFKEQVRKSQKAELDRLAEKTRGLGLSESRSHLAHDVHDVIACSEAHGVSLPAALDLEVFGLTERLMVEQWWSVFQESEKACKLGIGKLTHDIVDNMKAHTAGKSNVKVHIFSGHDSTIAPLLSSFRIFDERWPPFASNLIFELYQKKTEDATDPAAEDQHFVRLLYNNEVMKLPECKQAATENGELCPLNTFLQIAGRRIPKNYAEECKVDPKVR